MTAGERVALVLAIEGIDAPAVVRQRLARQLPEMDGYAQVLAACPLLGYPDAGDEDESRSPIA